MFLYLFFVFHDYSRFTGQQRDGEAISLTPLYHFHPLHRYLNISWVITARSSPLHIYLPDSNREQLVLELMPLTTKLRAEAHLLTETRSKLAAVVNLIKTIVIQLQKKWSKKKKICCQARMFLNQILEWTFHVESSFWYLSGFTVFQGTLSFFFLKKKDKSCLNWTRSIGNSFRFLPNSQLASAASQCTQDQI